MKTSFKYLIPLFILLISSVPELFSQIIVTSGSSLVISQSGKLVSTQNVVMHNGGNLIVNGTLNLKKDLVNQNTLSDNLGPGTVEFSGSVNQLINGPNVIENVQMNNAAGLTIGSNTTVNGTMTLNSGMVILGSNNLSLGTSATIAGSPSASAMIVPTASGQLIKAFNSGFTGSFSFPVGDNTLTPEYSPVTLTFTQLSALNMGFVGVNLLNEKYSDPQITGNYIKRFWTLTGTQIQSFTCDASFKYCHADVVGAENYLSCTKVNPVPWVTYTMTDTTNNLLTANGIKSFSSFTGVKSTTAPANNELANINIESGITNCYDATQVLTVAGSGRTFIVENGGAVTLIAGQKILILPGTYVNPGGYLHGRITTTGEYCGSMQAPIVMSPEPGSKKISVVEQNPQNESIVMYPNPASYNTTIEITGQEASGITCIEIINMNGWTMKTEQLPEVMKHRFQVESLIPGIYFIRVHTMKQVETLKFIKI